LFRGPLTKQRHEGSTKFLPTQKKSVAYYMLRSSLNSSTGSREPLSKSWTRCLRWAKSNPLASFMSSFFVDNLHNSPAITRDCRLESEHNELQSPSSRLVQRSL